MRSIRGSKSVISALLIMVLLGNIILTPKVIFANTKIESTDLELEKEAREIVRLDQNVKIVNVTKIDSDKEHFSADSVFVDSDGDETSVPVHVSTYKIDYISKDKKNGLLDVQSNNPVGTEYVTLASSEEKTCRGEKSKGNIWIRAGFIWVDRFGPSNYMSRIFIHKNPNNKKTGHYSYGALYSLRELTHGSWSGAQYYKNVYVEGLELVLNVSLPVDSGLLQLSVCNSPFD